ncbi:hypothetical protein [Streptomyces prasinus]
MDATGQPPTLDAIADALARAYDGQPLADLRDEHAALHLEAAVAVYDALPAPAETAVQALADINAVWASWTSGRLDTDDAMAAILTHLIAARENGAMQ